LFQPSFMDKPSVHSAALKGQLSLLRTLLSEDRTLLDQVDSDGRAPIHWAASSGSLEIVRYLVDQKAQVNNQDASGWTPLHIAASAGQYLVVIDLVGAGADINARNDKGITPLHYAASKGHVDIARCLIERGAEINARDRANQLPLHRAATTGSTGVIRLLLHPPDGSPKPRLNTADRIGNTPLHLAMESAHGEAAVLLIEAGADRGRLNEDGFAPEELEGVGGQEQKAAREYVITRCGKA